jgi:hypothetical protein
MKAPAKLLSLLILLLIGVSFASAQTTNHLSSTEIEQLREERTIAIFNLQNKHDLDKMKAMEATTSLVAEKADLSNKRHEIQIVDDATFPKYVEMNDQQKGSWEYAQAKKAWVEANPEKYQAMMAGANAPELAGN